mmetsp:Transcript_17594/g.43467  ORF Transcript_17594/g.43467 Transcript_17594/m.43467 type:complete len:226 (-) Transcript_17594:33-710(-)
MGFSGPLWSMNESSLPNSSQLFSTSVDSTASISQLKISHARYGYLNSRLASASSSGVSTIYVTSFSTTGRVFRKLMRRLLRLLHSCITSSSSRSSSSEKLSLSRTSSTGEVCTRPGDLQNMSAVLTATATATAATRGLLDVTGAPPPARLAEPARFALAPLLECTRPTPRRSCEAGRCFETESKHQLAHFLFKNGETPPETNVSSGLYCDRAAATTRCERRRAES